MSFLDGLAAMLRPVEVCKRLLTREQPVSRAREGLEERWRRGSRERVDESHITHVTTTEWMVV